MKSDKQELREVLSLPLLKQDTWKLAEDQNAGCCRELMCKMKRGWNGLLVHF